MEKRRIVTTDDLDGTDISGPEHRSMTLGLDDHVVVLDLSPKNKAKLQKALEPYLEAGLKVSARVGSRVTSVTELPATKPPAKRRRRGNKETAKAS